MPSSSKTLTRDLRAIVGHRHVILSDAKMRPYATGYRYGKGSPSAVVRPGSLVQLWRTLQVCVEANAAVILQAANTGLTGGSTPDGDYDRPIVVINTMRITGIHLMEGGKQVVCLPGATLNTLERILRPLGREPHSVIGSSCIGASVLGGVCNNSGGALIKRGPSYTELALYARINEQGQLELVNHLGIDLGAEPETILERVEAGDFELRQGSTQCNRAASDQTYIDHVRQIDEPTPARFNADPSRLYEASGSAGKVALFAVRLDTFPVEQETETYYIGTNAPEELTGLRRHILKHFPDVPVSGEYIHRDAFDIAHDYGKDTFLAIQFLGTGRLPALFALKAWIDRMASRTPLIPNFISDRLLQNLSKLFPEHLPPRLREFRDRYAHHLILKVGNRSIEAARNHLSSVFPTATGDFFVCSKDEAHKAFLHRFAVAGAAVRYRAIHASDVEDIVALDIALRRNDRDWVEKLPDSIQRPIKHALYYGHFFCHVFHQDYIVEKGTDPIALEAQMLELLDKRGAEYPAEHNVGHHYKAKPALATHYHKLDPCNAFNPGIGHTSKCAFWK